RVYAALNRREESKSRLRAGLQTTPLVSAPSARLHSSPRTCVDKWQHNNTLNIKTVLHKRGFTTRDRGVTGVNQTSIRDICNQRARMGYGDFAIAGALL